MPILNIPSRRQCLERMAQVEMPLHIRKHSLTVAAISVFLGRELVLNRFRLNLHLLEAAALLHDIAKPRSIRTGERHDDVGARMLEEWGYVSLAPIVKDHVSIDLIRLHGPLTESLIVNYADKRVKHDQIVTLEDRFEDLVKRYGKTEEHRSLIWGKLDLYLRLEQRIFDHLTIEPEEVDSLELALEF